MSVFNLLFGFLYLCLGGVHLLIWWLGTTLDR
jgi:hypothetical protein